MKTVLEKPQKANLTHTVKVVVPLYTEKLKEWELCTLKHNMEVMSVHPFVFIKPEEVDINKIVGFTLPPQAEVINVSSDWLGTKNGIAGYNRMMMSEEFYALFPDTTYILICHYDAWIFRDELTQWCEKGYDIVAAPWPTRPRYTHFPLKQWLQLQKMLFGSRKLIRSFMYGRIGNGGLCLRKVESFRKACRTYAKEALYYWEQSKYNELYNEDIFWAIVPQEFHYPTVTVALEFAFDLKPDVCYRLNNYQLPMGCHGFMHKRRLKFWQNFISGSKAWKN